MISIAIIDDRSQNRISLKEKILYSGAVEVLFTAQNGKDFLEQMSKLKPAGRPQATLMDIEMPVMDGIETVRSATEIYPETKHLMLTVFDDDDKIFDAIKAGASGYLLKDEKVEKIIEALHQVVDDGGAPMSPVIARKALNMLQKAPTHVADKPQTVANEGPKELSSRETEILKLLVDGLDHKDVAERLFLSPHTVRKHIANIYIKLHVTNRSQIVKMAVNRKWFVLF